MTKNFKCVECGEEAVDGLGVLTLDRPEGQVTIHNIPAKICPNGHQFFEGPIAGSAHRLARRLREDVQSYSHDLRLTGPLPEEISVTVVFRPVAPGPLA